MSQSIQIGHWYIRPYFLLRLQANDISSSTATSGTPQLSATDSTVCGLLVVSVRDTEYCAQGSHRSAIWTVPSRSLTRSTVHPTTTIRTENAHCRVTISSASTSPPHGNIVGTTPPLDERTPFLTIVRFAPHDTAHLIELMGGNVSLSRGRSVRTRPDRRTRQHS